MHVIPLSCPYRRKNPYPEYTFSLKYKYLKPIFFPKSLQNWVGFNQNTGAKLENAVYLELRRHGKDIYYFNNGAECDFIVREDNRIVAAYQVTGRPNKYRQMVARYTYSLSIGGHCK